jgi:hypothetical protein
MITWVMVVVVRFQSPKSEVTVRGVLGRGDCKDSNSN